MQQEGDNMVAEGVVPEHAVLHPERAVQEGIVLLGCPEFGPNPGQSAERAQRRRRYIVAVVPDELARERRQVGHEGREDDQRREPKVPGADRPGA